MSEGVIFGGDKKFDLQLTQALVDERRLAEVFTALKLGKVELKSETVLWEKTGNICIEFRNRGKPSGISTTEADIWVHELKRLNAEGEPFTLLYLMFPIDRLKALARIAIEGGYARKDVGDDGLSDVALIRLKDILR